MNADSDDINSLIERIKTLELENTSVRRELRVVRQTLAETERALRQAKQVNNKIEYRDRNGHELSIGNKVKILTKGRFPERFGTIESFQDKWVIIRDRTGIPQQRISKNVRLEDW